MVEGAAASRTRRAVGCGCVGVIAPTLTDEMLLSFASAETTHDVRLAIAAAYGSPDEED